MIELNSIIVMGDWDSVPEPLGRIVIRMPVPTQGIYGFWQSTTLTCIKAMESLIIPGMTVLDLGTGSGILAMVAHHLGASKVYAAELEPEIAKFARKVWDLNNVPVVLIGDNAEEVWEDGVGTDLRFYNPEVDLCVANIGNHIWSIRDQIRATIIINVSNKGELVVING